MQTESDRSRSKLGNEVGPMHEHELMRTMVQGSVRLTSSHIRAFSSMGHSEADRIVDDQYFTLSMQ